MAGQPNHNALFLTLCAALFAACGDSPAPSTGGDDTGGAQDGADSGDTGSDEGPGDGTSADGATGDGTDVADGGPGPDDAGDDGSATGDDADDGGAGDAGDGFDPDLLVPAQGALVGQYYGDESIEQTAQKLGRALPLHLTYYDFTHDWTGQVTQQDLAAGRIPFVNWEVFDTKLDEILSGMHDAMLADRAARAKALGQKFFLDFGAEMNGEWSPWGGAQNGMSPDKYVAAYRYVHDALAEVDNAIWVWCPNVTDEPRAEWNDTMGYYPGDEYVDWTCVDGYNWGLTQGIGWQSFADIFADIYPRLAEKGKPIMIGEMASAETGGDKAAWIDAVIPTLKSDYPMIKGLIWFDIDKETDWRISSSPAAEAAFKRMVNDPYFNP